MHRPLRHRNPYSAQKRIHPALPPPLLLLPLLLHNLHIDNVVLASL